MFKSFLSLDVISVLISLFSGVVNLLFILDSSIINKFGFPSIITVFTFLGEIVFNISSDILRLT